jgi:hypothetical protein
MTAMYQIANGKAPPIASHICVSEAVTSFLSACCAVDPLQRSSVDLLLTHPFVTQSHSDDQNLIIISDEDCLDNSDLPAINEASQENGNPPTPVPSRSPSKPAADQSLEPSRRVAPLPERGELTFKSRIPILQSRGMKVNVDSPDLPAKKAIEEQVTPSIYKLRKTRMDTGANPSLATSTQPQPPLMTPTPPTGERPNTATKFRKQASRGLIAATTGFESTSTPKSPLDSPTAHFSDQELSPVNQSNHFSPGPAFPLTRDESVPQLQSIESLQNDFDLETQRTGVPPPLLSTSVELQRPWDCGVEPNPSGPLPSMGLINEVIPKLSPQKVDFNQLEPSGTEGLVSPPRPSASSPKKKSTPPRNGNSAVKKKDTRYDSFTAPNREKTDFMEDSDDSVPAILINGSLMNSKGSLVEVSPHHTSVVIVLSQTSHEDQRPAAPLSSEKLNLCSDSSSKNLTTNASKKSMLPAPVGQHHQHQHSLKPLRKISRKYRSRSANPPSLYGPSKVLLPPMAIHQSCDGRPVSLRAAAGCGEGENGSPSIHSDEQSNPSPSIPLLQLRMIQSAPTVTRSVNLPPILGSKTPSKKLQQEHKATSPAQMRKVTKRIALVSLQKKASFEEHEQAGGILAPRIK